MRVFYIAALLICLSTAAFAQQFATVTGRVVYGTGDGDGVIQSRVTLTSTKDPAVIFAVQADTNGSFSFQNVPPGEYRIAADNGALSVSMSGEQRVTIAAGQNPVIDACSRFRPTKPVSASQYGLT